MLRDVETGNKLREGRLESGLSAEQSARVYGEALNGIPITRKAYLRMEEGYLPKDPKRRLILAGMFGLAPALLLGEDLIQKVLQDDFSLPVKISRKRKAIDIAEYHTTLSIYTEQGYEGTAEIALRDMIRRMRILHENVLYVRSPQKEEMKQLLCGYHMGIAEITRERGDFKRALDYLNDAIILAQEEHFTDFEAAATYRRGEFFFDQGNLKAALRNFKAALALDESSFPIPPSVKGRNLVVGGLAQARLARTDKDMTQALHWIDRAENLSHEMSVKTRFSGVSLSKPRYFLEKAKSFMGSPVKELRSPEKALECIAEVEKHTRPEIRRHYMYHQLESSIVQAQVWLDRGYYPIATTLSQRALELMEELHSDIHIPAVASIYNDLKTSSYGKSTDVVRLGVEVIKAQHSHLFN